MLKFILICIASILLLTGCSTPEEEKDTNNQTSSASRTSTNESLPSFQESSSEKSNTQTSNLVKTKETEIATFSTKIMVKEEGRQHNLHLTCNTLNGTRVEPRRNLFFL